MEYNEILAERVRQVLNRHEGYSEREQSGALLYLFNGNLACFIKGEDLILRVNEDIAETLLQEEFVQSWESDGDKEFVCVSQEGTAGDEDMTRYASIAKDYAASLPPIKNGSED